MSALMLVKLSYFVAATLFLLGLQRMASPRTARSGIQWAGAGMVLSTVATFFLPGLHNIGLMIAAVCGYMAGLIGASNSPVSGIGILAVIASSLMLVGLFGRGTSPETTQALIAYALIVTGIVFGVATISNDNLQDLKTGQLVGATPWKQQVALIIGVVFGSLVVPPVLNVLNSAFGFVGAPGARRAATAHSASACSRVHHPGTPPARSHAASNPPPAPVEGSRWRAVWREVTGHPGSRTARCRAAGRCGRTHATAPGSPRRWPPCRPRPRDRR